MNEARAVTNTIGNALATIIVAKWEGTLDRTRSSEALKSEGAVSRLANL
jgi:aerobic C4-dicarboxylate transport protein